MLDILATRARDFQPASIASRGAPTRTALATAQYAAQFARSQMIAYQEELDWECYRLYGLIKEEEISTPRHREHGEAVPPPNVRRTSSPSQPMIDGLEVGATQIDGLEVRRTTMTGIDSATHTPRVRTSDDEESPHSVNSVPLCFPPLQLGQRAFEIVLARKMAAGETQTTWFERHGSTPITDLPAEWPDDYRQLVQRRIDLIESDPHIRLIEQPEYKRRWNTEPWDTQLARALREWLLDRLESYFDFDGRMANGGRQPPGGADGNDNVRQEAREDQGANAPRSPALLADIALVSIAKLADVARQDAEFQQVGELYRDDPAFDVQTLVAELVAAECVPLLPVLRYKPTGLRKRAEWEKTWELQREEDRISNLKSEISDPQSKIENQKSKIPVPPKYDSKDFLDSNLWRLRGKLDVPKERWISFPHSEGPDGTLVIAWAGYDHLQQAKAISAYYVDIQERLGGRDDPRLIPLLAGMLELLPWLKQWHNEPNAEFDGMRMGDYFDTFITEEARQLNKTIPEIKAWEAPAKTGGRGRKRTS